MADSELGVLLLLGLVAGSGAVDRVADAAQRLAQQPGVGVPAVHQAGERRRCLAAPGHGQRREPCRAAWPARPARRRSPRRRGLRRACISSVVVPNPSVMSDHPWSSVAGVAATVSAGAAPARVETARKRVRMRTPSASRRTEPTTSAHAARTAPAPVGVVPAAHAELGVAVQDHEPVDRGASADVGLLVAHHLPGRRAWRSGSRRGPTRRRPPRRTRLAARRGRAARSASES